jgi:filamentous hemagglutinin family protein
LDGQISQELSRVAVPPKVLLALVGGCLLAVVMPRVAAGQHITIDGRFSPAQTLVGPNYSIGANLGKQVGSNLFHSFGQFSLSHTPTPESATFTPNGSTGPISNVIGRVTGGNGSKIDGKIQSNVAGANLYLINPNGVLFGPNATVNVLGGFHASTADYVKMSDGAKFQATNPDASTLSAAPPAAFGFLTPTPRPITLNGSTLGPVPGTLGLVAGPIAIVGGTLTAPAGTIHVTSVASTGEVPVDPRNTPALTVTRFGPVDIKGGSKSASTLHVSDPSGLGSGGSVFIRSGALTIDASEINGDNYGSGPGGQLVLRGEDQVTLSNSASVHAVALGSGSGARLTISTAPSGVISADASTVQTGSTGPGNGGPLTIETGRLTLTHGAGFTSAAQGSGNGGSVAVTAASVLLDGGATLDQSTGIFSTTSGVASGGSITIVAGELTLHNGAGVLACAGVPACTGMPLQSSGSGAGGAVDVKVGGALTVDSGASLGTVASATGNAGDVSVTVGGSITIDMKLGAETSILDGIGSLTNGNGHAGHAGNVSVTAGALTITNAAVISSLTTAAGNSGDVSVNVSGMLSINGLSAAPGFGTGIAADAEQGSSGNAGKVTVNAGTTSIFGGGAITSLTFGSGKGGNVSVTVDGQLTIDGRAAAANSLTGIAADSEAGSTGDAGSVTVKAGALSIVNRGEISSGALAASNGLLASTGDAGQVMVTAGTLSIASGGAIVSNTFGPGKGGSVSVTADHQLTITGTSGGGLTGIASNAEQGKTGNAGDVIVSAGTLTIVNNGEIASGTFGSGNGGSVSVNVAGQLTIDAISASGFTGIAVQANRGSTGDAGSVVVNAGTLAILNSGVISSNTFGSGNGGSVSVNVAGQLTIDAISANTNLGLTGISSQANLGSTGNAGSVTVTAGSLSIVNNGVISALTLDLNGGNAGSVIVAANNISILNSGVVSTSTFGRGAAGEVAVNAAGGLVIDSAGAIASSANDGTGNAGRVTVNAGRLSISGGGQIQSVTSTSGKGGDVNVIVASDIVLPDRGPQITARSTGSGDAGSITVSAVRLLMSNGAAISTDAASTANGGNIKLKVGDFLYLVGSEINTSVRGETGNGGNITIDPRLVIVNRSSIIAQAVKGQGGNININADQYIASADSIVSASSQLGISGTVEISGTRVDVNAALVVLSSQLRGLVAVQREACAARADQPISTLVDAGRGGLPQDPEATLPALYIAGRDVNPNPQSVEKLTEASGALQTTVHVRMRCG